MRRSTVLSLPLLQDFPAYALWQRNGFQLAYTLLIQLKTISAAVKRASLLGNENARSISFCIWGRLQTKRVW
jgi:hypothetical protein